MRLLNIFFLLAVRVVVKGNWWAAAVQPVIFTLGSVLVALDLDVLNLESIEGQNWMAYSNNPI